MKPQANSRRPEKLSAIQEIDSIIANSDYCFVLNYGGLTVASLADLRARLAKSQSALKVVKNTYLAKALETKGWTGLEAVLNGPTALVTGSGDPAEVAKSLMEFLQKNLKKQVLATIILIMVGAHIHKVQVVWPLVHKHFKLQVTQ